MPSLRVPQIRSGEFQKRRIIRTGCIAMIPRHKERDMESSTPSIIALKAEVAKLTMFRRTLQATAADRKGSVAEIASYRDGLLLAIKFVGKGVNRRPRDVQRFRTPVH